MNCKKCGDKIKFIESFLGLCKLCSDKEKKEQERLMVELEKYKQKVNEEKEKLRKAERIIKENTTVYDFSEDVKTGIKREKYHFYKSNFHKNNLIEFENEDIELINPFGKEEGSNLFQKEKIINSLIENRFDLKKTIDYLWHECMKEQKEAEMKHELWKIEERERRIKLREEAEKKFYGKVKNKRQQFTEEDKINILAKFNNECAICGAKEGLHIHHKDHDPKNNRIDNLIVLCGVCHKKIHMKVS